MGKAEIRPNTLLYPVPVPIVSLLKNGTFLHSVWEAAQNPYRFSTARFMHLNAYTADFTLKQLCEVNVFGALFLRYVRRQF